MNSLLGPNMQEYLGQILQLQRDQTAALESIAESLVKLANPPMALAEDDEYQGG